MNSIYDVLIIGGGAAGLCAAVSLKKNNPTFKVAVIEQLARVGKKLILTGNGRCNITNEDLSKDKFHSESGDFFKAILEKLGREYTENFFEEMGIVFTTDDRGRVYPNSLQASSVVDSLRFKAEEVGVEFFTETKMLSYEKNGDKISVETDKGEYICKSLLITAGLFSGGKKMGSDGSVFKLMKNKGYKTVKVTPAIVQIRTETDIVKQLKGIKVDATATLKCGGQAIRKEFGEVLFCDYGLSGPPIMQISRAVEREKGQKTVCLDLMPQYDFNELIEILEKRVKFLSSRKLEEFFTGFLNKRVGQIVVKSAGLKLNDDVNVLTKSHIKKMVSLIKCLSFNVISSTGFENSQVTAGGISLTEFDENTLMSRREKGVFAAGEILDVDGDCGGYNLQWAWSSAFCVAEAIQKYNGGAK